MKVSHNVKDMNNIKPLISSQRHTYTHFACIQHILRWLLNGNVLWKSAIPAVQGLGHVLSMLLLKCLSKALLCVLDLCDLLHRLSWRGRIELETQHNVNKKFLWLGEWCDVSVSVWTYFEYVIVFKKILVLERGARNRRKKNFRHPETDTHAHKMSPNWP